MNKKRLKRYINKYGWNETAKEMLDHIVSRSVYRERDGFNMPSLIDNWHIKYDDSGESWTEYGLFMIPDYYTDEEIQKCINEELWITIHSLYDCTGKEFTMWIDWHRNPNGMVSIIHHKGLDV